MSAIAALVFIHIHCARAIVCVCVAGGTTSQESECERESVCSDGSWIITPAPTFRVTGSQAAPDHPLENLLIEHPTMSVYGQMTRGTTERPEDEEEAERERERAQQAREMVILRNRQRMQVAEQLQLPLAPNKNRQIRPKADQVRVTRRAARRLNSVRQRNNRGRQTVIMKKCTFVAGRRRC